MIRVGNANADARLRWTEESCIHCGNEIETSCKSREHIPQKSLLVKPLPPELMTLAACKDCNKEYSRDEEYLAMLVEAVLAGSTAPEDQANLRAATWFRKKIGLRNMLAEARIEYDSLLGEKVVEFLSKPKSG